MKFYRCNVCGNLVELINVGVGELVCCGEAMEELAAKTEDGGREKHLPVVEQEGDKITVKVGSVAHPMGEAHYIQWIVIAYNNKFERASLKYADEPTSTFVFNEPFTEMEVYEYCNVHGLWKTIYKA